MRYLEEITGSGKPAVHRILKSDMKVAKASARWIPHLLSEDDPVSTKLVTTVNFQTSLIILMTCAGGSDL